MHAEHAWHDQVYTGDVLHYHSKTADIWLPCLVEDVGEDYKIKVNVKGSKRFSQADHKSFRQPSKRMRGEIDDAQTFIVQKCQELLLKLGGVKGVFEKIEESISSKERAQKFNEKLLTLFSKAPGQGKCYVNLEKLPGSPKTTGCLHPCLGRTW
jgi:hypothetical protein